MHEQTALNLKGFGACQVFREVLCFLSFNKNIEIC